MVHLKKEEKNTHNGGGVGRTCVITASHPYVSHPDVNTLAVMARYALCIESHKRRRRKGEKDHRAERRREGKREKEKKEVKVWMACCTVWFWFQLSVFHHLEESVSHELMFNSPQISPWLPLFFFLVLLVCLHPSLIPLFILSHCYSAHKILVSFFNIFLTTSLSAFSLLCFRQEKAPFLASSLFFSHFLLLSSSSLKCTIFIPNGIKTG